MPNAVREMKKLRAISLGAIGSSTGIAGTLRGLTPQPSACSANACEAIKKITASTRQK